MLGEQIISEKNTYEPIIDKEKCTKCGICEQSCWRGIFKKTDGAIVIDYKALESCIGCMECYKVCPTGALYMTEQTYKKRPEEIHSFYELCEVRQSCRDYSDKPVTREQLVQLAETIRLAPTMRNAQQFHLILIDDPDLRREFAEKAICYENAHVNSFTKIDLPYFALFIREKIKPGQINKSFDGFDINFDMGCLGAHFILAAAEMGLSTCLIGRFDNRAAEEMFGLEEGGAAFAVAIGYAAKNDTIRKKYRKEFDELITFNKY